MAGRKAPPSKVLNTLVFIKPLTSLQQKDAQTNEHKIYTGKISNKEVDPHAMSDYVLKHDNYIEYSDDESPKAHAADETENDSVKASPEDNPGGDRQQPKKKARADDEDPDFALYCSAKFILNEDEDNEDEEATEKTDQKEDSNLNDETIDTAAMVLSNEIITSGRACTVDLDTEKRLLQSLANSLHLQYEMENVFFQNEYMIKFNVNITFGRDFGFKKFQQLVDQLFDAVPPRDSRKLIVELPLDVITSLCKSLTSANKLSNYYRFKISNLSIGSLVNLSKYFTHFSVRASAKSNNNWMQIEIKMSKKCLIVYFFLDTKKRLHKLVYSFSIIKQMVLEKCRNQQRVYFDLISAPLLFYADLDEQKQKTLLAQNCCDLLLPWCRTVTFRMTGEVRRGESSTNSGGRQQAHGHQQPYCQSSEDCLLGMSKSFCIEVSDKTVMLDKLLGIANICKTISKNFNFYLANVFHTRSSIDYTTAKNLLVARQLPFSIYFACLVLFSGSYKVLDTLKNEGSLYSFLDTVKRESETNPDALEQCLYYLKIQCKEMSIVNVYNEFMKLLANQCQLETQKAPMNDDYVLIRRAILSPSHLELMQPIPLLKSRFSTMANLDYALRLTILDDNNRKLNNCKNPNDTDFVKNIIKSQLLGGIQIGDRLYEFLGSSSSQMRENGVIVYAKDRENRSAQNIRDLAGDLSSFKRNVAKYVARFGLMFSQAMTIIEIPETQVMVYITKDFLGDVKPDFKNFVNAKKEQHIFSDGVGIIARSVAQTFIPHLTQLRANDYFPSAFQIRYGGCKGMLVVYDTAQPAIVFRNSMKKYDSPDNSLGILKFSLPRPVFLNRPLINILDQLNVDRDEFYFYFEASTSSVAKALLYDSCALELVKTYAHSYLPYDRILSSGISLLREPFLRGIIDYLIYYRLNELKSRARIRIPFTNGRMAFGVIDETQTLEYGQIYFQYTKMSPEGLLANETAVLEGEVMVTKFPCLQPGDVRKLKAVRVESLAHIKDCIVFPSKGARPHPDEMGGSDLDGDEYAVFWDTKLMFPDANFDSMTFPYGMTKHQANDITINDIVEFYCNYLLLNNIGQVANTHLIYSDYHPKGLFSDECNDLAIKYSISLDYQKTGIIEPFPRKYLLNIRPDFMERFGTDKVYLSKRILGQFYRHCSLIERIVDLSQFDVDSSSCSLSNSKSLSMNPLFVLPGWKQFRTEAEEVFLEYKLRIVEIMEQLDIPNEVVLFSDVYDDKSDVSKVLVRSMFSYFKGKFDDQCAKMPSPGDRHLLASAWYAICFERCFTYNGKVLLGLPWIISEEICELAELNARNAPKSGVSNSGGELNLSKRIAKSGDSENCDDIEQPENLSTISLECQTKQLAHNTSVVYYYWSPTVIVTQLKAVNIDSDQLADIHHQLVVETQLKVTLGLAMKWIDHIKREIYQDRDGEVGKVDLIQLVDYETSGVGGDSSVTSFTEEELLRAFILKKLRQIHLECAHSDNQPNKSLPTISTLFNQFLMYMFELCNRVNAAIYHGKLEEIFLLKYAVFALSFLNKLDSKQDRQFYSRLLSDFKQNQKYYHYMLKEIQLKRTANTIGANSSLSTFPLNYSTESVYKNNLEAIFQACLNNNSNLVHETARFNLLPINLKIDLTTVEETFVQKLFFLTGLDNVEFEYTRGDPLHHCHMASAPSTLMTPPPSPSLGFPGHFSGPAPAFSSSAVHSPMSSHSMTSNSFTGTRYFHSRRAELAPANLPSIGNEASADATHSVARGGGPLRSQLSLPTASNFDISGDAVEAPKRFQTRQFHQSNQPSRLAAPAAATGEEYISVNDQNQYQVRTTGLVHSIMILRLFFGHPDFIEQVLNRFNIVSSGTDEDELPPYHGRQRNGTNN